MKAVQQVIISKFSDGSLNEAVDNLAAEEPLEIRLCHGPANNRKKQTVSVTMRTPGQDAELSAGFLFTEGIIRSYSAVESFSEAAAGGNTILISLRENAAPALQNAERNFYTTSSCGVCGKASIDAIRTVSPFVPPKQDDLLISTDALCRLPETLRDRQPVFNSTGGLHASALFSSAGDFLALREDIGRHNALDKLIGAVFAAGELPLYDRILLLSGRASFELIQKAAMAGIRIVAAIGAPSSLAVQLAVEQGITLVGFLRGRRFNIYSHGQRIGL